MPTETLGAELWRRDYLRIHRPELLRIFYMRRTRLDEASRLFTLLVRDRFGVYL